MDTSRVIDRSLSAAARILDTTAGEVRDSGLENSAEHIRRIGRALSEIFAIQNAIYASRPDLKPEWLKEHHTSPDNRALTEAIAAASEFEQSGNISGAIAKLETFLGSATSELHRGIAELELSRMKGRA